jgi:hypothetical protein
VKCSALQESSIKETDKERFREVIDTKNHTKKFKMGRAWSALSGRDAGVREKQKETDTRRKLA